MKSYTLRPDTFTLNFNVLFQVRGITLQFLGAEERAANAEEQTAKIRFEREDLKAQKQRLKARIKVLDGTLAESEKQRTEAVEEVGLLAAQVKECSTAECGICMDDYDDDTCRAVLYPCGHTMCMDCATTLWDKPDVDRLCYTCKQPLTAEPVQPFF